MWKTSFLLLLGFICTAQSVIVGYDNINYTAQFQDYEAEFGTEIGANGLSGILVAADPPDACAPITHRPFPRNSENITVNAFVLIQRGKCDFAIKVLNAQEANFNAAIVSNVGSDELLHMGTYFPNLEDQIHIPSVFVGERSGKTLNSTFIYTLPNDPHIRINRGEAPFSFKLYLIPFMAVVGCSFLILVCFVVVRALRERRRRMRSRLSRQRLKQLPSKQFHKGDDYDVCAICLDDYEEGDTLRILPCKHAYHCKCVDPWLTTTRRVCPLCKRRVLSDDDVSDSDDYDDDESDSNEEAPLLGGGSRSRSGGPTTTSSNPSTTAPNHQYGATTDMTSPYNNAICSFVPTSATPLIPPQSSAHEASGDYQQDPTNHMIFSQSAPTVTQAQQLPRMDDYIIDMSSSDGEDEEEDDTSSSSVDSQTADDQQNLVDEPAVADDDDKLDDDEMTHGEEESLLVDTSQESSSPHPHSG